MIKDKTVKVVNTTNYSIEIGDYGKLLSPIPACQGQDMAAINEYIAFLKEVTTAIQDMQNAN
jgi:hypothetical protein